MQNEDDIGYKHTNSSLYSKALFLWIMPLLMKGSKVPLEFSNLGRLSEEDSSRSHYDRFLSTYNSIKVSLFSILWNYSYDSQWNLLLTAASTYPIRRFLETRDLTSKGNLKGIFLGQMTHSISFILLIHHHNSWQNLYILQPQQSFSIVSYRPIPVILLGVVYLFFYCKDWVAVRLHLMLITSCLIMPTCSLLFYPTAVLEQLRSRMIPSPLV